MITDVNFINKPKVSIIITYHNLGRYIKDCVASVLEQNYKNYEIIIVNDFSDEKNTTILNEIHDEKIKIINLKENKGQLQAFLEGLKISSGEFICMVDGDDILLPSYISTLVHVHLNENVAFVSCSCGEINENNEITSLNYINNRSKIQKKSISYNDIEKTFNEKEEFTLEHLNIKNTPFGLWSWNPSTSACFRRESLKILNYFPDKKYWITGADKVVFSLLHLIGGSINISAVCYLYRHHNKNNSNTTISTGNKKYLSEKYTNTLIEWNKKLRIDTIKMFLDNKKILIEQYNKLNYFKMLFRIVFCINRKVCAKILKTFAHKLINF